MKLAYLIASFFIISICFACDENEQIEQTTNYQSVVDTVITFDPSTYEESMQIIRYKLSEDRNDTVDYAVENVASEKMALEEANIKIVVDNETGVVDTIVTFSVKE
ncbi:MAG: hypothetical protein AAF849_11115 [Bacteroidota bacterium]